MLSKKLLHIEDGWFNLPDDFNGTIGEALMLLAEYKLEQEKKGVFIPVKGSEDTVKNSKDMYTELISNDDVKGALTWNYFKLDEESNTYQSYIND